MLIAQLSDIHLDGVSSLQRLDRVLQWVAELRPDAVAVSGDLANNAHVANYAVLKARLEALGAPLLVVPGNVDSREAMREVFGGPAITRSDLLIVTHTDIAPYVNASLEVMEADTQRVREGRPYVFADLLRRENLDQIIGFIEQQGGLVAAQAAE